MTLRAGEWAVLAGSVLIAAFAALVGALIYRKPPPVTYAYREDAAAQRGEAVYRREGCGSCHQVFGNGATYGPGLDGVGTRRDADWLRDYLVNPRPGVGVKPYRVRMPSYASLPAQDQQALVAYLLALHEPAAPGAPAGPSR
jgi:cbb3-type cytochrome oxidase cytochrome c subunit